MRKPVRVVLSLFVCAVAASVALAQEKSAAKPKMGAKGGAKLVAMTPDEMKWVPNPGDPKAQMAVVWGDAAKGAHGAFHKFPAGFATPLHTHSGDIRFVVISGTMVEGTADGKETKLPPGSYCYQPHTAKHTTKCDTGSECVIYATDTMKFDLIPAEPKK